MRLETTKDMKDNLYVGVKSYVIGIYKLQEYKNIFINYNIRIKV